MKKRRFLRRTCGFTIHRSANLCYRLCTPAGDFMRELRLLLKEGYENSYGLIIGINQYQHASNLGYAASDASEFKTVLEEDLGFSSERVTLLLDEHATKANILKELARFSGNDINSDDRIVVFFAGHGHTRTGLRGEVGYLVPQDGDVDDSSTLIRWSELTNESELIRAKHILFIMDACYGGLAITRNAHAGTTRFLNDMYRRYARQVLTAGKADETVADSGGPLPNHSVFTGHLIEGMRGAAYTEPGLLTANGLMSYVYHRVANDKNSKQTPHYGYFDGDGDFILLSPTPLSTKEQKKHEDDVLFVVPAPEDMATELTQEQKLAHVKALLSSDSSAIQLHDFLMDELRQFLSATSDDNFPVQGQFKQEEVVTRISQYESALKNLSQLVVVTSSWAKSAHLPLLQKVFARIVDRLEDRSGNAGWLNLRWYPAVSLFYCCGMAAIAGQNYAGLAAVAQTSVAEPDRRSRTGFLVDALGVAADNLRDVFKQVPGHEKFYTPLSEYLFKNLQPQFEDLLFLGKDYERTFDEFEIFFAEITIDNKLKADIHAWGPIGRFGWKGKSHDNGPLQRLSKEATTLGQAWPPLRAGLFGGDAERHKIATQRLVESVGSLHWF